MLGTCLGREKRLVIKSINDEKLKIIAMEKLKCNTSVSSD